MHVSKYRYLYFSRLAIWQITAYIATCAIFLSAQNNDKLLKTDLERL